MAEALFSDARRQAGLDRLAHFIPSAGRDYARKRNFDLGPRNHGNVSMLSPFVRHRLVLEPELIEKTLQRHTESEAEKFIEEVFWRTYFKGWLEQRPSVWSDYWKSLEGHLKSVEDDSDLRERYEAAIDGRTGIDCFDAWIEELLATGYLHNHSRMWFASIWVFTLKLPWQLGADLFLRHLIDGDPASNTLGWRWVCGLHTKGTTYLARVSNITSYTGNRFNPSGKLAVNAPALHESVDHPVVALPTAQIPYPGMRFGLAITEEDCCPETLLHDSKPDSAIVLPAVTGRSPLPASQIVREFTLGALLDAASRVEQHFSIGVEQAQTENWTEALLSWASSKDLHTIVTSYTPVGPAADQLAIAREALENRGIRLMQIRRHYDSVTWPHASKGFFKLKAQIPQLLIRLGIPRQEEGETRAAV